MTGQAGRNKEKREWRMKLASRSRIDMLHRASQFVSIALSIIVFALPISACLTSVAEMTAEQRECCEKMAGRCEMSAMPSSHSCCQHPVSQQAVTGSKIQRNDCGLAVTMLSKATSPLPQVITRGSVTSFESPPEESPQIASVLRI